MSLGLMVAILGWHVAGVNSGMLAGGPIPDLVFPNFQNSKPNQIALPAVQPIVASLRIQLTTMLN